MGNIVVFLIGVVVGYVVYVIVDGKHKPKYALKTYDALWEKQVYFVDCLVDEVTVSKNLSDAKRFDSIEEAFAYNKKELEGEFEIIELINWK